MKKILPLLLLVISGASCNVTKTADTEGVNDSVEISDPENAIEMKMVTSKTESRYYVPVKIDKMALDPFLLIILQASCFLNMKRTESISIKTVTENLKEPMLLLFLKEKLYLFP